MGQASALGLGLSTFVSVGNKADVSGNDLLCYWEQDDRTDLVLLYSRASGTLADSAGSPAASAARSRSSW